MTFCRNSATLLLKGLSKLFYYIYMHMAGKSLFTSVLSLGGVSVYGTGSEWTWHSWNHGFHFSCEHNSCCSELNNLLKSDYLNSLFVFFFVFLFCVHLPLHPFTAHITHSDAAVIFTVMTSGSITGYIMSRVGHDLFRRVYA